MLVEDYGTDIIAAHLTTRKSNEAAENLGATNLVIERETSIPELGSQAALEIDLQVHPSACNRPALNAKQHQNVASAISPMPDARAIASTLPAARLLDPRL